jgi:hypothetical protein
MQISTKSSSKACNGDRSARSYSTTYPLTAADLFAELEEEGRLFHLLFCHVKRVAGQSLNPHEIWGEVLHRIHRKKEQMTYPNEAELERVFQAYANFVRHDLIRAMTRHSDGEPAAIELDSQAKEAWRNQQELEAANGRAEFIRGEIARLSSRSQMLAHMLVDGEFFKPTGTIHQSAVAKELGVNQATVSRMWAGLKKEFKGCTAVHKILS